MQLPRRAGNEGRGGVHNLNDSLSSTRYTFMMIRGDMVSTINAYLGHASTSTREPTP